ncbi:MAG: hypothetical protein AB8G86_24220 [Saprospiraceae bacterium]
MKAEIYSNRKMIGTSELQVTDEYMGVISGEFIPNDNYNKIRRIIWDFHNLTSDGSYKQLEGLRLNVRLANGYFLFPIGGFLITDIEEIPNEKKELEVAGICRHLIEDNFLTTPPKERILEPWEFISIDQKIEFEDELSKEIGRDLNSGIFNILKRKHSLCEFQFSATAKSCRNDDVLFAIHKKGKNDFEYTVIHLTWKGELEKNGIYPKTEFHKTFDDFLNNRMYPDKKEWDD